MNVHPVIDPLPTPAPTHTQNLICLAYGFAIAFVFEWRMALVVLGALPFMISGSIIYYQTVTGE